MVLARNLAGILITRSFHTVQVWHIKLPFVFIPKLLLIECGDVASADVKEVIHLALDQTRLPLPHVISA